MKIGIIGAGMIGGTLARRLTELGHDVAIANSRGPETLREFAAVGARPVTLTDAAQGVDMVIVAIPMRAVPLLPTDLFADVPAGVVVIDANNYYPARDGSMPAIDRTQVESAWVGEQLGRPVIKAFNSIGFMSLRDKGRPRGSRERVALSVAGDPPEARATVLQIVDDLGFDPVDAGGLEQSWRQQPGTPCYCRDFDAGRLTEALAAAERDRIAEYRKAADDAVRKYFESQPPR